MQALLIKQAKIVDAQSTWNGKTVDILIENGIVTKIGTAITHNNARVVEYNNLHVSPGFFDPTVNFCDPGEEQKEDIYSGIAAAAAGGFTLVGVTGNTHPAITEKTRVEYIKNKSNSALVSLIPSGCVSAKNEGKELAELYDMHQSGASWFYDGKKQLNTGLLSRALSYAENFGGIILSYPDDKDLTNGGLMHEGLVNIHLGLKGMPAIAEELGIIRDNYISTYHNARLHVTNVSTAGSIEQLKKAKTGNTKITAQCSIHHLFFCDEDLTSFDSNLKINPPLRSIADREQLLLALKNGVVDNVTSDHEPQDVEAKKMEFDMAEYGAIGLETCFAALNTVSKNKLSLEEIIYILATRSRKTFGLPLNTIAENIPANLVLYNPDADFSLHKNNQKSKAYNNPYLDKKLKGQILGIVNEKAHNL